jgi:hypothetical protein
MTNLYLLEEDIQTGRNCARQAQKIGLLLENRNLVGQAQVLLEIMETLQE